MHYEEENIMVNKDSNNKKQTQQQCATHSNDVIFDGKNLIHSTTGKKVTKPISDSYDCAIAGSVKFSPAFDVLMSVVNKRRPYEPDDFVKETFIPDLCLAAPLAVGVAVKLMPMVQYMLTQGKCL